MSTLDHKLEPELTAVHRLEVISGTGRRRQFTADFKARVVEADACTGRHCLGGRSPAWAYATAGLHVAPAGASFAGEYREQGAAVRASHCGGGGTITGAARTAAQADRPGRPKLRKHRGRDRWHDDPDRPRGRCEDSCGGASSVEGWRVIGPTGAVRVLVATKTSRLPQRRRGLGGAGARTDAGRSVLAAPSMCSGRNGPTG